MGEVQSFKLGIILYTYTYIYHCIILYKLTMYIFTPITNKTKTRIKRFNRIIEERRHQSSIHYKDYVTR